MTLAISHPLVFAPDATDCNGTRRQAYPFPLAKGGAVNWNEGCTRGCGVS